MTTSYTHMIHRQTLELSGDSFHTVNRLEADSHGLVERVLNPVIEACFDSTAGGEAHLVIDTLTVDLGVFRSNTFMHDAGRRLRELLKKVLSQYEHAGETTDRALGRFDIGAQSQKDEEPLHMAVIPNAAFAALLEYLKCGTLPWWWSVSVEPRDRWLELEDPSLAREILACLRLYRSAILRAVESLGDRMLEQIAVAAGSNKAIQQGWQEIQQIAREHSKQKTCRVLYWEYCLGRASGHMLSIEKETMAVVMQLHQLLQLPLHELEFFFTMVFDGKAQRVEQYFHHAGQPDDRIITPQQSADVTASPGGGHDVVTPQSDAVIATTIEVDVREADMLQSNVPPGTEIFPTPHNEMPADTMVTNAGLVIIHPFLPEFFRDRKLLDATTFRSPQARSRAVQLLDCIMHGVACSAEYDLLLPKLLCGMPWHEALVHHTWPDEEDTRACDELLQAVISHWRVLGRTSPDGLREAFFKRSGILKRNGNDWGMRVEQKAQDVLLGQMPWGIGTIRMPWMQYTLFVSWT